MAKQTEPDFDVKDFSRMLQQLPAHAPISDAFTVDYLPAAQTENSAPKLRRAATKKPRTSEREHMVAWFAAQDTRVKQEEDIPPGILIRATKISANVIREKDAGGIVARAEKIRRETQASAPTPGEKRSRRAAKRAEYSARAAYQRLQNPRALLWIGEALGAPSVRVQEAALAAANETDRRSSCRVIREYLPWKLIAKLAQEPIAALRSQATQSSSVNEHTRSDDEHLSNQSSALAGITEKIEETLRKYRGENETELSHD